MNPFGNPVNPLANPTSPFPNPTIRFGNPTSPFPNPIIRLANSTIPFPNPMNPFRGAFRHLVKKTPVFCIFPRRTSHGGSRTRISQPWTGVSPAQPDRMERLRASPFAPFVSFAVQSRPPYPRNPGLAFRPPALPYTPRPQAGIHD